MHPIDEPFPGRTLPPRYHHQRQIVRPRCIAYEIVDFGQQPLLHLVCGTTQAGPGGRQQPLLPKHLTLGVQSLGGTVRVENKDIARIKTVLRERQATEQAGQEK